MAEESVEKMLQQILDRLANVESKISQNKWNQWVANSGQFGTNPDLLLTIKSLQNRVQTLEASDSRTTSFSQELAESITGAIGLKESITTKHRGFQCVWIFLFLTGVGATCGFLFITANDYMAEPTLTKVTREIQPMYRFPPIVLCNDAWFDTQKALQMGLSLNAFKYSLGYWQYQGKLELDPDHLNSARQEFHEFYRNRSFLSLVDYYKSVSVDLNMTNSVEEFKNSTSPSYYLPERNFTEKLRVWRKIFLPTAAVCYEFLLNPVDGRLGFIPSTTQLHIKFQDKTGSLLGSLAKDWDMYLINDARIMYTWPLTIQNEVTSFVTIKQQSFIAYNRPESPCVSVEDTDYKALTCIFDCYLNSIKGRFHCELFWLETGNDAEDHSGFCNFFDEPFPAPPQPSDVTILKEQCPRQCPPRCQRNLYEATLGGEEMVGKEFYRARNMSTVMINFLHGAVYQGGVLRTEEVRSYTFPALVNDVGGTLGLFVGGTIMTFFQLIMFLLNSLCRRRKNKIFELTS